MNKSMYTHNLELSELGKILYNYKKKNSRSHPKDLLASPRHKQVLLSLEC